jgi:hypothetical protein
VATPRCRPATPSAPGRLCLWAAGYSGNSVCDASSSSGLNLGTRASSNQRSTLWNAIQAPSAAAWPGGSTTANPRASTLSSAYK